VFKYARLELAYWQEIKDCRPIKRSAPEAMWKHCMIHRESLTTEELCREVSEVMGTVIKTVNYTKTRPLRSIFFAELFEEMWAQYQSLLLHSDSRWL
jgi:hypothetical protein